MNHLVHCLAKYEHVTTSNYCFNTKKPMFQTSGLKVEDRPAASADADVNDDNPIMGGFLTLVTNANGINWILKYSMSVDNRFVGGVDKVQRRARVGQGNFYVNGIKKVVTFQNSESVKDNINSTGTLNEENLVADMIAYQTPITHFLSKFYAFTK